MKKYYLFAGLALLAASPTFAQTKIGGTGAPDGSAMLEVTSGTSGNKGLLLPRMTLTQRNAIPAPATGLMIYNTTANQVQVNTGTPATPIWVVATAANSGWDLSGNGSTNPATNFIGTTDNQPLAIRTNNTEKVRVTATGNVGIGNAAPGVKLQITDTGDVTMRIGNTAGGRGHIQLGNDNHGLMRDLTGSGGQVNDVALFTSTGSGPTTASSLYLVSNPTSNGSGSLPLDQFVLKNTGDVGIGTNTPAQKLHVEGTARIATAIGIPTTITGRNAAGDVGNVALGTGLSLTAGTLSVTGGTNDWDITGNAGTNPATNFIGTSDNQPLVVRTNNTEKVRVTAAGDMGIGTGSPAQTLHVAGTARIATAVGTPTSITGRNAAGDVGNVTLGTGLSLTAGTLSVTGGTNEWDLTGNAGTNPATNFIGTSDAQPLVIRTSNVEQLRVTAAGDVGIGTTTPAQSLHVQGTARIATAVGTPTGITGRNAAGDIGNITLGSGLSLTAGVLNTTADNADWNLTGNTGTNPATNFIGTGDAQPLVIRTSNTEKVRVTAAGNVGIGTASPAFTLDVSGGIKASNDVLTASGSGAATVWNSINAGQGETELINYRGTGGGGFRFFTAAPGVVPSASVGELMRITGAGNVGIGTSNPSTKLNVNGGSLTVSTDATTPNIAAPIIHVINNGGGPNFNDDVDIFSYGNTTTPEFGMWTARGTASSPQNAQANDYAGVVRFGTWVSGAKTELNRIQSVYTGDGTTEQSRLTFHATSASSPLMSIESNGNVGIGTISPTATLSVNGPANNTTGTWSIFSDARVKTVDGEYEDGLATVMKIHPVKFHYNANAPFKSKEQQIGIIAQEMEQIAPYMVSRVNADGFKDLRQYNNQALPYMLVNAIQEQQAQIEALKAKNEQLEAKNIQLEAANKVTAQLMERVKQMEQMMGINEMEGTSKVAGK